MDIKKIWFDQEYIYGKDEEGRTLRQSLYGTLALLRLLTKSGKAIKSDLMVFTGAT